MPQISSHSINKKEVSFLPSYSAQKSSFASVDTNKQSDELHAEDKSPLNNVVSQLNELSQSFVDSFQDLEGKVEQLSDELESESVEKQNAIAEKEKLFNEKVSLSKRLQELLSIMPAGVVVLDASGKVKDCNEMAIDILGEPLLGELWINVIQRVFDPQVDDGHQVSLKDGRKIHIETKGLNSEPGQLIVLTDMTKTRKLQAELSQQQKLLSMGQMVASMAHQIRTPLSAAILYGSHLNNQNIDGITRQEFTSNLVERLNFMERQIADMLNFVKGERKQKQYLLVTQLLENLKQLTNEFSDIVSFDVSENIENKSVFADKDALLGAFVNLIENAVQAATTKPNNDAKVWVKISCNKQLKVVVEDNGVGIKKENISRVFEPFYKHKKTR